MSRRLLPLAFAVGLVLAACAKPPQAEVTFGSGKAFVPQVADAQDDVGLFPSVAVSADGVPYVAYFGFPQQLAEGEVAIPRPVGAPSVPSILLTSVNDGIWTRGAVAMQAAIPNVDIAFGPATVEPVKSMKPQNVNGTAIAIDGAGGLHVAWVSNTGVWYAHSADGTSFSADQVQKARIDQRGPIGQPSIAVDGQGVPTIAYTRTTAAGQEVEVARQSGGSWTTDTIERLPLEAGGSQPGRTAIAISSDGSPVVLYDRGSEVVAAVLVHGGGFSAGPVESGVDGAGLSVAIDGDGTLHAAYYAGDAIHTATSKDGSSWDTASVAAVGTGGNEQGRSTGIGTGADGTTYVTWYDPGADEVRLASGSGSDFSAIETSGASGGDLPTLAVNANGQVYVAWYDETDQNLMLGTYGDVGGLELAIQSPTPTGAEQPAPSPTGGTQQCTTAQNGELSVTAQGLAFDTGCIQIPAGQKVTIHFDNKDAGTQHNIAVYPSANELTTPLFRGDLVTGPNTADYQVGPLKAGEYYFHCDVHPTMNGTFKVVSGGGTGGGGGGTGGAGGGGGGVNVTSSVTASGLAFDTNEIDLAAGKATTITFDNQDAGVPHNIAIYPSQSEISPDKALFQGEVVTGPTKTQYKIPALKAGTYFFHCDVHPTMTGTVVVR
jgi:plastocyanin